MQWQVDLDSFNTTQQSVSVLFFRITHLAMSRKLIFAQKPECIIVLPSILPDRSQSTERNGAIQSGRPLRKWYLAFETNCRSYAHP